MAQEYLDKTKYVLHESISSPKTYHPVRITANNPQGEFKFASPGMGFESAPQLRNLLDAALRKRPTWRFIATGWDWNNTPNAIQTTRTDNQFYVFDGDEMLGHISWGYGRGGNKAFVMDSPDLAKERYRGSVTSTTNEKRALYLLMKAYHKKSPTERLAQIRSSARDYYGAHVNKRFQTHTLQLRNFQKAAESWANKNFEAFIAHPGNEQYATLDADRTAFAAFSSESIYLGNSHPWGTTIQPVPTSILLAMKQGSSWLVSDARNVETTKLVADHDMSAELRARIVMLSMLAVGSVEPGIGCRASDDGFVVVNVPFPA